MARGKAASDPAALFEVLREHCLCPERIVMETGTMSSWLARELRKRGLSVDVIDARQAHAVLKLQHNKTDAGALRQAQDEGRASGRDRALRLLPAGFGEQRGGAGSADPAQGALSSGASTARYGEHDPRPSRVLGHSFSQRVGQAGRPGPVTALAFAALEGRPDLQVTIEPLLASVATLKGEIERLDQAVMARAQGAPACRLLMSAPGVGPVTALAFAATIDEPARFAKSRTVGAYVGLTTRRFQSGEMDYSGRISKHGDAMLRSLLYEAANSMLTVVRKAHPLKDWARRIRKRTSHKKACVALARKLAVILHRMMITGEPFRWPESKPEKKAATTA